MDAPDPTALGRADDEDPALAAESARLAEEDEADRAARASGSPTDAVPGLRLPQLDPESGTGLSQLEASEDPEEDIVDDDDDSDPGIPIEGVDVDAGVDEVGEAPDGEELTSDERSDIAEQLAAIRQANEHLPPDQRISTSPEDVN
jgi:hypothetical protein